jgi:hypothetical protein
MVARAPRKRMYRTMQGRMVDIEKLRSANESVQAVGNMNVNARGDVLGSSGQVVTSKAEVIKKYYEQPKGKVSEGPASTKQKPAQQPQVEAKAVEPKKVATPKVATPKVAPKRTVAPKKGIDAALDGLE